MKKIIFVLLILTASVSCKKEQPDQPASTTATVSFYTNQGVAGLWIDGVQVGVLHKGEKYVKEIKLNTVYKVLQVKTNPYNKYWADLYYTAPAVIDYEIY